jgi:hypothetical protein
LTIKVKYLYGILCDWLNTEERSFRKKCKKSSREFVWKSVNGMRSISWILEQRKSMAFSCPERAYGYYANMACPYRNEKIIKEEYVKKQGRTYHQIHRGRLTLFEWFV